MAKQGRPRRNAVGAAVGGLPMIATETKWADVDEGVRSVVGHMP
jgi:hypothetical protein